MKIPIGISVLNAGIDLVFSLNPPLGEIPLDKCDECGKRIAKDLQICRACFKIYKANRKRLADEALEELKGIKGPV